MKKRITFNPVATLFLPVLVCLGGCQLREVSSSSESTTTQLEIYGKKLNRHSSPTNVAEAALLAIGHDDLETLTKLIATQRVMSDVTAITHGKSKFTNWVNQSPKASAEAIAKSMRSLSQPLALSTETIHGDQATVVVASAVSDRSNQRLFYLCREHGCWKLVPSHR